MSSTLRICTNDEMRKLDQTAEIEMGIGPILLMENAGRAASEIIVKEYPSAGMLDEILVFAGKGNNAGDAFVVARQLLGLGRKVRIFHLVKGTDYKGATRENFKILENMKAKLSFIADASDIEAYLEQVKTPELAIDGIIGTGLRGNLDGHFHDIVELINARFENIVSLDIPTGVHGDSGQTLGTAIQASLTISFGFPRLGHFLPPGASFRGKLVNVDISLPHRFSIEGDKFLLQPKMIAKKLRHRDRYAHKNTFGHVLLLGGSPGRTGAIAMATQASLRSGAGLATAATWMDSSSSLARQVPVEAMMLTIPEKPEQYDQYENMIKNFSAIVVGPGLGLRPDSKKLVEHLLSTYQGPVVLDADALNQVAEHKMHRMIQGRKGGAVLTPHPGEMARLINWKKEDVVNNPIGALQKAVELTHAVVLLKGAATLMLSPDEVMYVNHFPNSGMATAGSGDVLAGMIGGLLAQGLKGFDAAQVGVFLHSLAGDLAAKRVSARGMIATDIIKSIPGAYRALQKEYGAKDAARMVKLL